MGWGFGTGCVVCEAARDAGRPRDPVRRRVIGAAAGLPLMGAAGLARAQGGSGPDGAPPQGRYAVRAGWALTEAADGAAELLRDASVIVEGDRIEAVREGGPGSGMPVVEAPGALLLPGLISGHTHACSATPTRGIIEGGRSFARPLELVEELSDGELDALTAYNVAELLLSGCTGHVEMSLSLRQAESYARVARRWGVRGWVGGMVPGIGRLFPIWFRADDAALTESEAGTLEEIAANLAFARRLAGDPLLVPMMAPHAADTQTPATLEALAAAAAELGTGIHIHLAQGAREVEAVRRMWGTTPARWLADHGLMDGPFFGAHMSALDFEADGPLLRERGAVYAHCPSAGGAGGGTQPYPEALAAGVATSIGIDTHSNDMVENLKLAVLYGQARASLAGGGRAPTIRDAVEGATRVAADGLGRTDLGRIRPGAKADLVAIDVSGWLVGGGALPPEPLHNLLYAGGAMVRHVATDGAWQVWNGRLVVDDPDAVARAGGDAVRAIWERLAAEGWFEA